MISVHLKCAQIELKKGQTDIWRYNHLVIVDNMDYNRFDSFKIAATAKKSKKKRQTYNNANRWKLNALWASKELSSIILPWSDSIALILENFSFRFVCNESSKPTDQVDFCQSSISQSLTLFAVHFLSLYLALGLQFTDMVWSGLAIPQNMSQCLRIQCATEFHRVDI